MMNCFFEVPSDELDEVYKIVTLEMENAIDFNVQLKLILI